jgi:ABC-type branched-subunit amino acid transport system substrate-binding protein
MDGQEMAMKSLLTGVVGSIVTLILIVAAPPATAQDKTLVIGGLQELTGPLSASGPAMTKALKLAVQEANKAAMAAGLGWTVKEEQADTQGDAQTALSAARSLVDKGASCLIGPGTTPESIAIAKGLTIQKKVILLPQATSGRLTAFKPEADDTIFRTVPPDTLQGQALADAVESFLGSAKDRTVSVAYRNEPYGEGLAKEFGADWQAKGGKVQGPIGFDPNQATFDSEAEKIVAGNPDAYLIVDYPDSYVKMGAALLRTGKFDAKKLFVPDVLAFTEVPKNIPAAALEGAKGARAGSPETSAAYKAFDQLWKAAGGTERYSLDANTFDATLVCFLSAVAAGSPDPAAIKGQVRRVTGAPGEKLNFTRLADAIKALRAGQDIDFEGVSGPLDLDKNGDPTTSLYDIFQFKNGRLEVIRQVEAKKGQ